MAVMKNQKPGVRRPKIKTINNPTSFLFNGFLSFKLPSTSEKYETFHCCTVLIPAIYKQNKQHCTLELLEWVLVQINLQKLIRSDNSHFRWLIGANKLHICMWQWGHSASQQPLHRLQCYWGLHVFPQNCF